MKTLTLLATAALLVVLTTADANAQRTRTIEIRNGMLLLDGKQVPPSELPSELKLDDVTLTYRFMGGGEPFITVGDAVFQLRDNRLHFTGRPATFSVTQIGPTAARVAYTDVGKAELDSLLQTQAVRIYNLSGKLRAESEATEVLRAAQFDELTRQLASEAERMTVVVHQLPALERQRYIEAVALDDTHRQRLQRELELEARSQELARQIRSTRDERRRRDLERELESVLVEAFELKQQNRREEIIQVERKLETLRQQLRERERQKKEIVRKRMDELTGRARW